MKIKVANIRFANLNLNFNLNPRPLLLRKSERGFKLELQRGVRAYSKSIRKHVLEVTPLRGPLSLRESEPSKNYENRNYVPAAFAAQKQAR